MNAFLWFQAAFKQDLQIGESGFLQPGLLQQVVDICKTWFFPPLAGMMRTAGYSFSDDDFVEPLPVCPVKSTVPTRFPCRVNSLASVPTRSINNASLFNLGCTKIH